MIDAALRGYRKFRVRVYWTVHQPYCDFLRLMGKANFAADVPAKAALRAENPKQGEWNGTDKKNGQSGPFWNVEKMQERILAYLAVCIGSYVLSLVLNPLLKKI